MHSRKELCETLARVPNESRYKLIDRLIDIAEDKATNGAAWECALSEPPHLLKLPKLRPILILIVDDEQDITASITEIISSPSVYIKVAATAEQAQRMIPYEIWDAVFLDINLPGISGLDLLAQVKGLMLDTRFYIISAYGHDKNKERARSLGVVEFIDKPFQPEILEAIVEDIKASVLQQQS